MFKKLVALTLAALMFLNPMTAFAVSWNTVVEGLRASRSYDNGSNLKADVDDEGKVTIEGYGENGGSIEDFIHSDEFKSYEFKGKLTFGGASFEVYVKGEKTVLVDIENDDVHIGAGSVKIGGEDGAIVTVTGDSLNMGAEVVKIENGAVVAVEEVHFHTNDAQMDVTNKGELNARAMFVGADENAVVNFDNEGKIRVEDELGLNMADPENELANDESQLNFNNKGDITAENFWALARKDTSIVINNEGTISMEVGEHENPNEDEEEGPSDVLLMTDDGGSVTLNNEGEISGGASLVMGHEDEGADATGNGAINNYGVITDHVHAFIYDNATAGITNSGMIDGAFESYIHGGASSSLTNTETGTMIGGASLGGEGASVALNNQGTMIGGEIAVAVDGNATGSFTNSGIITEAERVHANAEGNAAVSFTNSGTGTIDAGRFDMNAVGSGTFTGSNFGSVDSEWGFVGAADNASSSFTNEGTGYIHTQENFDVIVGNWEGDENYPGYNPDNYSNATFINHGEVAADGAFSGNLQENGSLDIMNSETGTITVQTNGVHAGITSNGEGTVNLNNAGTVDANWLSVSIETTGEATVYNSGMVSGDLGGYGDGAYDEEGNHIHENVDGKIYITNDGTAENIYGGANGGGSIDVSNNNMVNNEIWIDISSDASGYVTNYGEVGYKFGAGADGNSEMVLINSGFIGDGEQNYDEEGNELAIDGMWGHATGNGSMTVVNDGYIVGEVGGGAHDNATNIVVNAGRADVGYVEASGTGSLEALNEGYIVGDFSGYAFDESGIEMTNNAVIGKDMEMATFAAMDGAEQPADPTVGNMISMADGEGANILMRQAEGAEITGSMDANGANGATINVDIPEGAVVNEFNISSTGKSQINSEIGGEVNTLNIEQDTESESNFKVRGTIKEVNVTLKTDDNKVPSPETVEVLMDMSGLPKEIKKNVITVDKDGNKTALFVINDGKVELVEKYVEEQDTYDDPATWTKERIRHHKEMERQAAAIGGVTGSPYWVKQLYLGYMSLNLRLFNGEEQLLFKESLKWVPDTGVAGEKILTLNIKLEDTSKLMMRLDGAVIDKLEQAGIVTINIVDGTGNLFMTYQVEDLKDARAMYGLTEKEYIVVGGADADVLKIAEDGTVSPIEGDQAEEVADEANKETAEEAAEETPAA